MLGAGYATGYLLGAPLLRSWLALLLGLVAVIPGAVYVSLVNDLTDLEDDRAAGKHNRLSGRPKWPVIAAAAACLVVGWTIALLAWPRSGLALVAYGGAWLAFSFYSIPPVRLKGRGLAGVFADASGANLFPTLLIIALVFSQDKRAVLPWWVALLGAWTLLWGVRGILWHQLGDIQADQQSGVRTLVGAHARRARQLETYVLFPVEAILFCTILVRSHNLVAIALLPIYGLYLLGTKRWNAPVVIVSPPPREHRLAMADYYVVFFPLAFLVAAAIRHPRDAVLIAVHLALFHRQLMWIARDAAGMIRHSLAASIRLLAAERRGMRAAKR